MFNTNQFKKKLQTEWLGSDFIYKTETASTNSDLKRLPSDHLIHGTVLLTDSQVGGRGQYERSWISETGKNLTFTIALKPHDQDRLSLLNLVSAWGVIQALNGIYGCHFYLKWPNDILTSSGKAGGILTESIFNGSKLGRVLVGIGLNVNQLVFPGLNKATSLALEVGEPCCREELLCRILEDIEQAYKKWQKHDIRLIHDINRSLDGFGGWVRYSVNGNKKEGKVKFLGINEKGHLRILKSDMEVKIFTYEQIRIHTDY